MITPITPPLSSPFPVALERPAAQAASDNNSFTSMVGDLIKQTEASQVQADAAVQRLITGETTDIHQVMLAMEQARLSMLTLVEVRNKVVEAYQELSRMPI